MKMPLLDIKNLSVNYSNVSAVAGVSLSVEEGEVVVLIGANGAGKSSVLRALFGLTPSESDVMSLDTMDLRRLSPQQRVLNGMALVPETRELFSGMTIEDNLKLGLFIHKEELSFKKELDRISHLFPILMNRLKQRAGTLSGGEQQMLALARALMQKPRLLCLDEPSLGLAPKLVGDFYALLKKIVEQGVGLLLVEQQARRALAFGMRGYVLNVGEMVKQGSCTELAEDEFVKSAYLGRGTR
jgi:branched-chain amino acid transport system ATP-binding protein